MFNIELTTDQGDLLQQSVRQSRSRTHTHSIIPITLHSAFNCSKFNLEVNIQQDYDWRMTDQLEKSNKFLRLKSHGKGVCVVREVYRRDIVPCQSPLCLSGCQQQSDCDSSLPKESSHYLIPDPQTARDYLEILEDPHITGIIFTQTTTHSVQHEGSRRLSNRLRNIVKDKRRGAVIFHNEFQKYAFCEREPGESLADWQVRATYHTAEWFYNHLAGQLPIVMLTKDEQAAEKLAKQTPNVFVMTMKKYLTTFWKDIIPGVLDLYQAISASLGTKTKSRDYVGYLPMDVLNAGLKTGQYIQGYLQVNRQNAANEAFIRRSKVDMTMESSSDILIHGAACRNRAVHGDLVVVELLSKSEWRGRSLVIKEETEEKAAETTEAEEVEETEDESSDVMPTGKVVGVIQRGWREYVACFSQDEERGRGDKKAGKVLVIPLDYRIPKIRISTRQVDSLRDSRIIVRIDAWEVDSQYPSGHFVRSLGQIGDLEAEIAAILIENNIQVPPFSEAQMKELPVDTAENPWKMSDKEISSRRDLRDSHLIFSIDPKGCEDVDDTLSVRTLKNGNIELGVHIADVTHFVTPGSLSDLEAQSRSTTVYLADRRYDMLPSILSANLCSLISGVDRYAVSVIWELNPATYEVLDVWYGRTVIRSTYKLFYEFAQALHEGLSAKEAVKNVPELQLVPEDQLLRRVDELRQAVNKLMEIARHLKARRVKVGALELESVEVQVQLNETRSVADLTPKEHMEIHDTIAECMIFANHWVAKKITETFPNQALLRHHPLPKEEQFSSLQNCASARGFEIRTTSNKDLAESLDKCVDPSDPVVNQLLRSLATMAMSNAAYFSTGSLARDQFFHYGLALDLYTHFTSPIRRYADVVVHRQLMAAVEQTDHKLPSNKELDELSQHINKKHRASQYAQRESQELFQCLFFKGRSSDDEHCIVDAVIFQLRANGVFVFIPRYGIKGPVYLRNKEGQVVYVQKGGISEWTAGTISHTDQTITVDCLYGEQVYTLLTHITVRVQLNDSRAHSSTLKLELLSNSSLLLAVHGGMDDQVKSQKAAIIKEVSSAAEEKRSLLATHDLGPNFEKLKQEYGQTSPDNSLYSLFESFKDSALCSSR